MQMKRLGLPAATAALMALGAETAWAAGIGSPIGAAVLGQPLNLAVPLRLEAGDAFEPRCITAEVTVGDRRLSASAVSAVLELVSQDLARVRVQTLPNVDEPVVSVLLHVGCQARLTRRFVVLADPPGMEAAAANPAPMPMLAPALPLAPAQDGLAPANARLGAAQDAGQKAGQGGGRTSGQSAQGPRKADAGRAPRPLAARPSASGPAAQAQAPARRPAQAAGQAAKPATRTAAVRQTSAKTVATAAPRLTLDNSTAADDNAGLSAAEMLVVEQAIRAVAEAASAVRAANSAASAAEQRALGLERSLAQTRAENQTQREAGSLMRERLARSEAASNWLWPLLAGLLGLGALAGWLAWQLAALRREQRRGWQEAAHGAGTARAQGETAAGKLPTAPLPFVTAAASAAAVSARPQATPAWPPPAPAEAPLPPTPDTVADGSFMLSTQPSLVDLEPVPAMQQTLPLPVLPAQVARSPQTPAARDLSIEELIDLEQQAEFFVVLGQDDAAIDLLVEHVRSTGGGSPLPYLKLLEIYHRLGDREAYERTRTRFNQRFNAYAAEWSAGLLLGRSLEDYPGVLPRLAQAWPRPLDAMAELEALLFRKSHGELFDLPAYREVLFLYALARDLLDREAADTGNVDLLLPLADGGDFGVTSPHPYFGLDHDSVFDRHAAEDRPTSPVDLDLSQGDSPQSIFDPLAARRPSA